MAKEQAQSTLNISMRPKNFDEVLGLENEKAALLAKIETGNIPRAFTFIGPFGCGKTTLAYIVARAIQGWDFEGTPVVEEINAANLTGVSAMRELADAAGSYPMVGKYRVIILDEAHKLSKPAQELLLKEFESPTSPTVWIICTTDPSKLIEGLLKGGRLFAISVRGMDAERRKQLVERAAKELGHTGDITEFLTALTKGKVVSPRRILMSFEMYHFGIPAAQAVNSLEIENAPEYFEISMGVLFGQWAAPYSLPMFKDKKFTGVADLLTALDAKLKRKPKEENETPKEPALVALESDDSSPEPEVEEGDLEKRPEVANAIRAVVAATLKNQIARESKKFNPAKAMRAAESLQILANCVPSNSFGLEFPLVVGALYRVHLKMQGK